MTGTTTRKLVRQEWMPLAGGSVTRFVAQPASDTVPGLEWTDDLPGKGYVENEVLGYAEFLSGRRFPSIAEERDFRQRVEAESVVVQWFEDDGGSEASGSGESEPESEEESGETQTSGEDETAERCDDDGLEQASEKTDTTGETMASGDEVVLTVDREGNRVEAEYHPQDEPYRLPEDADPDDLKYGVLYDGTVTNTQPYGVFVQVPETSGQDDVSGLVHRSHLGLQSPSDFVRGDQMVVELESRDGDLSWIPHSSDRGSGLDRLFSGGDANAD